MALTPNDVLNKQFQTTKFRDGYDQDEVDDFLDEVLAEFQRLIAENDQLKSQVGAAPSAEPSGEVDDLRAQLASVRAELDQAQQQLKAAQDEAASGSPMLDGMNSAEYLQLARRVHEEHVREGVAKRDEAISEGEAKAAQILADAQAKQEQLIADAQTRATELSSDAAIKAATLVTEAQSRADALLAEAQTQRDTQLEALAVEVGELGSERDSLETTVESLKEFEREYRNSLKTYLKSQLSELKSIGADSDSDDSDSDDSEPDAGESDTSTETTEADGGSGETEVETTSEPLEDTTSRPGGSFQWEPPSRSFDAPAESDAGSSEDESSREVPPAAGFGGN